MIPNNENSRSAYGPDAFRPRPAPGTSGRERREMDTKPDSERMREMFDRVERADKRAKEIQQKIESRIRDLNAEIGQTAVTDRAAPMRMQRQVREMLQSFLSRYGSIAQEYLAIRMDDGNGRILSLGAVHAALDERFRIVSDLENMLREFEQKVHLERPSPEQAALETRTSPVSVPEAAEQTQFPVERLYPYYGHRSANGQLGGNEHIILAFSTGWGHKQNALRNVSGNQGAEGLGVPQSIMLNNIRGKRPWGQEGTERGFGANIREAQQMDSHRRALEETGISVSQMPNGTLVRISYIPEGEYVEIEGEQIRGPIGHAPTQVQEEVSPPSNRRAVRDAAGFTGAERRAQLGLDRPEEKGLFNGRPDIRRAEKAERRTGRTRKQRTERPKPNREKPQSPSRPRQQARPSHPAARPTPRSAPSTLPAPSVKPPESKKTEAIPAKPKAAPAAARSIRPSHSPSDAAPSVPEPTAREKETNDLAKIFVSLRQAIASAKNLVNDSNVQKLMGQLSKIFAERVKPPATVAEKPDEQPFFGFVADEQVNGIVVGEVLDGPSERAGLRKGDRITKFGGQKIQKMKDMEAALKGKHVGDRISVELLRDERSIKLIIIPIKKSRISLAPATDTPTAKSPESAKPEAGKKREIPKPVPKPEAKPAEARLPT